MLCLKKPLYLLIANSKMKRDHKNEKYLKIQQHWKKIKKHLKAKRRQIQVKISQGRIRIYLKSGNSSI